MRKIISLLMTVAILLSASVMVSAATDEQKVDLKELGIMIGDENGDLRLNDTITRAEVAKMICVAGELTLGTSVSSSAFPDVHKDHWAYNYIYTAKENGIVVGDENGFFNPESKVTNEEIIKMVVSLLGYSSMADTRGGFPAGYNATATQIGLTKDMQFALNTPAIRNDVAKIISNALDIPLLVEKSEGNDEEAGAMYVIADGKNGIPRITLRGTRGMTWDTSLTNINKLAQDFASQYPYKEGDTDKSIELYPDVICMLGMEKTADGVEYECPAIYDDRHAYELVNTMVVMPTKLIINDKTYETEYAIFNKKMLVPYDIFKLLGCDVFFNKDTYVSTISKSDTTLEIIPNITGMRKNQAEGYWVPLEICARFVENKLFVPIDAVAKEFGYVVEINNNESSITLK